MVVSRVWEEGQWLFIKKNCEKSMAKLFKESFFNWPCFQGWVVKVRAD